MNYDSQQLENTLPPEITDRYNDFHAIGEGGMGRIVSAFDTVLNKRVALKLLPVSVQSATAVVRFQQEARAVSKLNHMHVVQVLDFAFSSTGEPVLIMEYIEGEDLDSIIERDGPFGLKQGIDLAVQICKGLEHAHTNSVIHRDLKPKNVMLDKSGTVRILDFGLARIMDQSEVDWRLTRPGQFMGTPLYMSPEQIRGENADERSDVYGLGLLLFKMLTGSIPHEEENILAMMRARLEDEAPRLPSNPEFPRLSEALDQIIQRCLNPDVEARFTMTELREALEQLLLIEEERPTQSKTVEEAWRPRRTDVILLVVVGLAGLIALFMRLEMGKINSAPLPKPAQEGALPEDLAQEERTKKKPEIVTNESKPTEPVEESTPAQDQRLPVGFTESYQRNRNFFVARDYITDNQLKRLLGRTDVRYVSLDTNTHITERGIEILSNIPLQGLLLRDTRIDDKSIKFINRFQKLEWLDLRNTKVSDAGVTQLKPNTLIGLDLNYDRLVTDRSVKHIAKSFPKLKHLNLSNTSVTRDGLKLLVPLHLYGLSVADLGLKDEDMDLLVKLRLQSIDLESNTEVTDAGLRKLEQLENLSWLGLQQLPKISDDGVERLRKRFPKILFRLDTDKGIVDDMTKSLYAEPEEEL